MSQEFPPLPSEEPETEPEAGAFEALPSEEPVSPDEAETSTDLLPLDTPVPTQSMLVVPKPPSRGLRLWKQLNTPIYLRRYYQPWMLSLLSLLAIGGMGYGLWKLNARNPAAIEPPPPVDESVALRFYDVELRGRKTGTPFFTIFADIVEVSKDQRYVYFLKGKQKPRGEFFNLKDWEEEGEAEGRRRAVRWEAENAEYDTQLQNLRMMDNVKIVTDTEDIIVTDEMLWNRQDETLSSGTRSKVRTHKDTYMESNKLQVKTRDKELYLEGQVFIEMKLGQDQTINIEEYN